MLAQHLELVEVEIAAAVLVELAQQHVRRQLRRRRAPDRQLPIEVQQRGVQLVLVDLARLVKVHLHKGVVDEIPPPRLVVALELEHADEEQHDEAAHSDHANVRQLGLLAGPFGEHLREIVRSHACVDRRVRMRLLTVPAVAFHPVLLVTFAGLAPRWAGTSLVGAKPNPNQDSECKFAKSAVLVLDLT